MVDYSAAGGRRWFKAYERRKNNRGSSGASEMTARDRSIADELEGAAVCALSPDPSNDKRYERRLRNAISDTVAALRFIASREPLMFAECSVAEEIIAVAKVGIAKAESQS